MGVPNDFSRAELSRVLAIVKKDVNTEREDAIIARCRYIIEQCEHAKNLKRELFQAVRFGEHRTEVLDYWITGLLEASVGEASTEVQKS